MEHSYELVERIHEKRGNVTVLLEAGSDTIAFDGAKDTVSVYPSFGVFDRNRFLLDILKKEITERGLLSPEVIVLIGTDEVYRGDPSKIGRIDNYLHIIPRKDTIKVHRKNGNLEMQGTLTSKHAVAKFPCIFKKFNMGTGQLLEVIVNEGDEAEFGHFNYKQSSQDPSVFRGHGIHYEGGQPEAGYPIGPVSVDSEKMKKEFEFYTSLLRK